MPRSRAPSIPSIHAGDGPLAPKQPQLAAPLAAFGAVFAETAPPGKQTVSEMLGIPFSGNHRLIFLYYIILMLALITNLFTQRMRRLPVGRAWEALREDETA